MAYCRIAGVRSKSGDLISTSKVGAGSASVSVLGFIPSTWAPAPTRATDLRYASRVPLLIRDDVPLAPLTTLELGGRARHLVEASDEAEALQALGWAAQRALPLLPIGGGSNLVV